MIIDVNKLSKVKRLMITAIKECPDVDEIKETSQSELFDMKKLYSIGQEHEVIPILFQIFRDAGLPLSDKWGRIYQFEKNRIAGYFDEIHKIGKTASENGIEFILLKNGSIAEHFIDDYGKCPMGDIDVMCREEDFTDLHRIILSKGFELNFRNPNEMETEEYIESAGTAEYFKQLDTGDMWLEISTRSVSGRWIRPDQEPDTRYLFKRSKRITDGIRVLDDTDNLLQVALHTAKHSYVRAPGLRLHLDVERIVRHGSIDWEYFTEKCLELRVKTPVYFSLLIPRILFNTPIPANVLNALRPSSVHYRYISSVLRRVSLFGPHDTKFSKFSFAVFQIMLYDSIKEIAGLIFPDKSYMQRQYKTHNHFSLFIAYIKRLSDIFMRKLMI